TFASGFSSPQGLAIDSAGNIYVADNQTIQKVTPTGGITTLAGLAGVSGSVDGPGVDARFYFPIGVAVDSSGNGYVAARANSCIRKIDHDGVVITLAGRARAFGSTDGTGPDALFLFPTGVAVDRDGNVYVADNENSTIRKVTPGGETTTIAGIAQGAGILLGGTPRLALPAQLAIVGDSLVISDTNAILALHHGVK